MSEQNPRKSHIGIKGVEGLKSREFSAAGDAAKSTPPSHALPAEAATKKGALQSRDVRRRLAIMTGSTHELHMPKVTRAGVRAFDYVMLKKDCPWKSFEAVYRLKFEGHVTVATRKSRDDGAPRKDYEDGALVAIKEYSLDEAQGALDVLQQTRHENVSNFKDAFAFRNRFYAVFEYDPTSLAQFVACPVYPSETQLAAIVGQIVRGLEFLASKTLIHGRLRTTNILVNSQGVVKLSDIEGCRPQAEPDSGQRDARAVGMITMELMQKYCKDDGRIGVEDLVRWPSDSPPVTFLSCTTSAISVKESTKQPLVRSAWKVESLRWIMALADLTAHRQFQLL